MLNPTLTPTGTIYRTECDGQGRFVSSWVGTDDTPTTGFWSPNEETGTFRTFRIVQQFRFGEAGAVRRIDLA